MQRLVFRWDGICYPVPSSADILSANPATSIGCFGCSRPKPDAKHPNYLSASKWEFPYRQLRLTLEEVLNNCHSEEERRGICFFRRSRILLFRLHAAEVAAGGELPLPEGEGRGEGVTSANAKLYGIRYTPKASILSANSRQYETSQYPFADPEVDGRTYIEVDPNISPCSPYLTSPVLHL